MNSYKLHFELRQRLIKTKHLFSSWPPERVRTSCGAWIQTGSRGASASSPALETTTRRWDKTSLSPGGAEAWRPTRRWAQQKCRTFSFFRYVPCTAVKCICEIFLLILIHHSSVLDDKQGPLLKALNYFIIYEAKHSCIYLTKNTADLFVPLYTFKLKKKTWMV